MTCPHLSRIGTRCTRPEGHTGPHVAGFTKEESWTANTAIGR